MLEKIKKNYKKLILIHIVPLIICGFFGAYKSVQLGQDLNWDLLNYHYNNPEALLKGDVVENYGMGGVPTYVNPALDIVPYFLIKNFPPIWVGAILGAIQGINMWLIFEIGLVVFSRFIKRTWLYLTSGVVAIGSFLGAGSLGELGNTMGDNTASIIVLLSLLLILLGIKYKDVLSRKQHLWLKITAYLILGIAVGVKFTNLPYAIALFTLELIEFENWRLLLKRWLIDGAGFLSGLLIGAGAWSVYMMQHFQSPLFPFFNKIFNSPYYYDKNFIDTRWLPMGIKHVVFYPFYFMDSKKPITAEVVFRDPRLAVLYVAVMLFAVYLVWRLAIRRVAWRNLKVPKEVFAVVIFSVVSYIIWEKQFGYYRYLIVLEFLAVLVVAAIIWVIVKSPKIAIPLIFGLSIFLIFNTKPMDWGRIKWQPDYFGVKVPSNVLTKNSTVLLAGGQPLSFMIHYFPEDTTFIRISSDLSSAADGNTIPQQMLRQRVADKQKQASNFYTIQTQPNHEVESQALAIYGYRLGECKAIDTYVSKYLVYDSDFFKLCRLNKL